ncbi:Alanine racemase [Cystobacter fuscus DSM 2262]|uniref:Broad specificity amino-acid racemase n=1 Tax=Cystobacter fuscus (strain ATCC 25194 / DSM 2262 / NBRC 100088 / M29) TaxID=1242864 RepID=S9PC82_CYSF2|nr:alanine racemase [Cystobacter fuscus]EPX60681.1 Alanine racemase [Cystobacter fuscus DSM 2262]
MSHARMLLVLVAPLFLLNCRAHPGTSVPRAHVSNAWVEINTKAFEHNLRTVKARLSDKTQLCAVMKADAYGHGIDLLIPSIVSLSVPCVAIASNEDAQRVRDGGFGGRLVRIRTATPQEVEDALPYALEELVGNLAHAKHISDIGQRHARTIPIHLDLNARGVGRNGLELSTARGKSDALELLKLPHLQLTGIMTQLPVEDREDVLRGLALFKEEAAWIIEQGHLDRGKLLLHCANSFATLDVPESHLDMVRPGGAIYGETMDAHPEFKQVMEVKTRVASVNAYPAGSTIGYDRTATLQRDSLLANIPMGYADGYRRDFSNQGHVLIRGRRHPVVGRISMNTFMVDVTEAPDVQPGDEVVLFGHQGVNAITQAELQQGAGTLIDELRMGWGRANPRVAKSE